MPLVDPQRRRLELGSGGSILLGDLWRGRQFRGCGKRIERATYEDEEVDDTGRVSPLVVVLRRGLSLAEETRGWERLWAHPTDELDEAGAIEASVNGAGRGSSTTYFLLRAIPALASKVEEAVDPRKSVETTSSSV